MSDRETTAKLEAAVLRAFPVPEYATFLQVADGTGARQSRWADAVAMSCWPSRGYTIWGFELKASRGDWLREKKDPGKSVPVQRFCNHWALVTVPGVVEPMELPATWGLMELHGRKLQTVVKPPQLDAEAPSLAFIASLLRSGAKASKSLLDARLAEATRELREQTQTQIEEGVRRQNLRTAKLEDVLAAFKAETGIDLGVRYPDARNATDIGKGFAAYQSVRQKLRYSGFEHTENLLRKSADMLAEVSRELAANGLTDQGAPRDRAEPKAGN